MPVGLSPCRSMKATRKNSAPPGSTTLCAPTPKHRRRSDEPCGTKPSVAAGRPPTVPSADARTSSPTRTDPTVLVWFFGSPTPTTASVSRTPGACASPERSPLAASASRTTRGSSAARHRDRYTKSAWVLNPPSGSRIRTQRTGTANKPVEYHTAVVEAISTLRSPLPYQLAIVVSFQTVLGSWATRESLGKRSPLRRGLPI